MKRFDSAKQFFEAARDAKIERLRCEARLEEIFTECRRTTAHLGGVGGGSGDVHKDQLWAAYADLRSELSARILEMAAVETAAENYLKQLTDARHRAILSLRYIGANKWSVVEEKLRAFGVFYEERQIRNLHDDALAAVEKLWRREEEHL